MNKIEGRRLLRYKTQLNHQVHIPKGKKLIVNPGQKLVFGANGGLIVEGELQCLGTPERLIHFSAENNSEIFKPCIF